MTEEPLVLDTLQVDALADGLSALSNAQRLRILHLLTRPLYAEEIARQLQVSRQSVVKHLDRLAEQGFVRAMNGRRPSGPVVEYLLQPSRLFALAQDVVQLAALEPRGGPRLAVADPTVIYNADGTLSEPQMAGPAARLVRLDGPAAGEVIGLEANHMATLGRDGGTVAFAHDPYVSATHAQVVSLADGGHEVIDAESANGTFVNFRRLPRGGRLWLRPGDIISVGRSGLVYQSHRD